MFNTLFFVCTIAADLVLFFFAGLYFFEYMKREKQLDAKEKELDKRQGKVDTEYHQIVDNALNKERKILEDATGEADTIISQAKFATQNTQEKVNKALEEIIAEVHKETAAVAQKLVTEYQTSIKQLTTRSLADLEGMTKEMTDAQKGAVAQSLTNFQTITHTLETGLQKQIKEFHESLLPNLEKEVETYKQERFKQVEQLINHIIQKVSQKALHKTISLEDHKNLIVEALERAKKEGVFD